jgi:hypothetical protein
MKYLLGGAALAALAIAVPVWAAPAPMSSSAPSTAQPAPEAQKPRPYTTTSGMCTKCIIEVTTITGLAAARPTLWLID